MVSTYTSPFLARSAVLIAGLMLAGCATAYGDRGGETENPLKGLATIGGLATNVPEPKDFVKESRPETLNYIPIGVRPDEGSEKTKPLSAEELLLLQQKLEAAQKLNTTPPATE